MPFSADEQIKAIQAIIGTEPKLDRVPEEWPAQDAWPLLRLMAYEEKRPKYALDESGSHVIGLNLAKLGIDDDKWDQVLKVIDPALLRALNLSDNQLGRFSTEGLPRLETLNLNGNSALTAFSFPVGGLTSLVRAELNECAFAELVVPAGMSALEALNVRFGKLARLVFGGDCPALAVLDVRDNQLAELSLPAGFGRLGYLNVDRNRLESIRFGGKMEALHSLWLKENKLRALPEGLLDMPVLEALYLYGNAFEDIQNEVISGEKGANAFNIVKIYLERNAISKKVPLHQAKMILVGNGMVGKSSIRIKLLDPEAPLPKPEERTFGLEIKPYPVKDLLPTLTQLEQPIDFLLNIWDFGGQGKFRELQQLFCSRKSLYLYVTSHDDLPENDDYMGLEYWLSMVNAYSFDEGLPSPVIHVVNKIDETTSLVNQRQVKETFSNIDSFRTISCKDLTKYAANFNDLKEAIKNALPKVSKDIFKAEYFTEWIEVKNLLETRQADNHMSYEDYWEEICKPQQLKELEAREWLRILDRIGTVIYFGDNLDLKDWIILNPSWVKDAIYRVVEDEDAIEHEGVLSRRKFDRIWQEDKVKKLPGLTEHERDKMIQLMLAYKLCYEQRNNRGETEYVIPALFSNKKRLIPAHLQLPDLQVKFYYKPFIPAGTVNKLIVTVQSGRWAHFAADMPPEGDLKRWAGHGNVRVYENLIWRNNVVLHDPANSTYAWVTEDWEDKAVYLKLFGKDTEALFGAVVQLLESIKADLVATKYIAHLDIEAQGWLEDEWVPLKFDKLKKDFFAQTKPTTSTMHLIQQLIAQARLGEALTQLHDEAPDAYKGQVIQLQGRLNTLLGKERSGTIDNTSANIERNSIMKNTLDLLGEIQGNIATASFPSNAVSGNNVIHPSTVNPKTDRAKIFISYSHKNEQYKNEIENILNSLKDQDWVETWNDRKIEAGEWDPQIKSAMESSDIFIFVITNDFINSDYISKTEITTAYQRYLDKKSIIIPLVFEICPWQLKPVSKSHPKEWHEKEEELMYPWMGKFQAYPTDAKAVEDWDKRNAALNNIFEALKSEIKKLRKNS